MSYVSAIFYAVQCDRCGEHYCGGDYEYHIDEPSALESAQEDGWIEVGNEHYCPCCYKEENDENVPLKPFPPIYWTARAACKKLGTLPHVKFKDDRVIVESGEVSSPMLIDGVIDWMNRQHNNGNWGVYTAERVVLKYNKWYNNKLVVEIECIK